MILKVVRDLSKEAFYLSELYEKENDFASVYPRNRHIREKIRQQLQVLRDLGVLRFKGNGRYELTD
jgi:type II restriction enzyme